MTVNSAFEAISVVGGVVPPGLLGRIQAGEVSDTASLAAATYHLGGSESIRDAGARSWSYLRGVWQGWQDADAIRTPGTAGTGTAREKWLLVLLRDLGYGQVPAAPTSRPMDSGDAAQSRDYPISHRWQHVPIHLLGPGVDLDRRNPGVAGASRAPQAMVQEFLNRNDENLWAILSNGRTLRLLRDSTALAGAAYLEFDLQAIFDGELYPEFLLLWQLAHQSRLEKRGGEEAAAADCWLEDWRSEAVAAGSRALDRLSAGVERALDTLGDC